MAESVIRDVALALAVGALVTMVFRRHRARALSARSSLAATRHVAWPGAAARAHRRASAAVPDMLDAIAAELRGGAAVAAACVAVGRQSGALHGSLAAPVAAIDLGMPVAEAFASWRDAPPVPSGEVLAGGLALAAEAGGPAAGALEHLAAGTREALAVRAEVYALSTQARVSAYVVALAPVGFVAFSVVVDPGSATALVATPVARIAVVVGLALDAIAAWWMRSIVAGIGT